MYTSPELQAATDKLINAANANSIILGLFLFGTERVAEFLNQGYTFISIGNDLHHVLTQSADHITALEAIARESEKQWAKQPTELW